MSPDSCHLLQLPLTKCAVKGNKELNQCTYPGPQVYDFRNSGLRMKSMEHNICAMDQGIPGESVHRPRVTAPMAKGAKEHKTS